MAEFVFGVINVIPLPFWGLMILAPGWAVTRRVAESYGVFMVLGALYLVLLVSAAFSIPPGPPGESLFSLAGLRRGLGAEWGLLAGWSHFLTLDLFAGRWIYFDTRQRGGWAPPFLFLTFLAGPLGLLSYLLWRQFGPVRSRTVGRGKIAPKPR